MLAGVGLKTLAGVPLLCRFADCPSCCAMVDAESALLRSELRLLCNWMSLNSPTTNLAQSSVQACFLLSIFFRCLSM